MAEHAAYVLQQHGSQPEHAVARAVAWRGKLDKRAFLADRIDPFTLEDGLEPQLVAMPATGEQDFIAVAELDRVDNQAPGCSSKQHRMAADHALHAAHAQP